MISCCQNKKANFYELKNTGLLFCETAALLYAKQ